jgi:hypothetical protein
LWAEFGNLLSHLDDRIQSLQHDLSTLHLAHTNLVRHLYQANEVYVAAAVPDGPETPRPVGAKVEGTA